MLVTGPGPCLRIYPMQVFEAWEDQLDSQRVLDEADADMQMLQRMFYNGDVASLDQQFRLTLPRALRSWAEFGKQENETVIIIGMGDKLELWSHTAWEAYNSEFTIASTTAASKRLRERLPGLPDAGRPGAEPNSENEKR